MELSLPNKFGSTTNVILNTRVLVVIGTNGAGKSSFGKSLLDKYPDKAEKVSGLHALFLNNGEEKLFKNIGEGFAHLQSLVKERLLVPRLSDYEKLVLGLLWDEFEQSANFKENYKINPDTIPPVTKIDQIQQIWEKMFPHNRLVRKAGFIELMSTYEGAESYTAGRMSDSEKLVFYLIGTILQAREEAILIIEEPETLLHNSIKTYLWDELEKLRPDCTFVYLTHDIDFAASRSDSERVWIRSFNADEKVWDYQIIERNESFPEDLYMEILGSRKPILFIEGTDTNSIDSRLYPLIFTDYLVKPMGGCQKVIETTKAFSQLKDFHMLESIGIVDRDRRTEGEIEYLRGQHIFVPNVAEVENLLMLEPVIKTVAKRLMKDEENVFEQVKENVVHLFEKDLDSQVILHAKHLVRKKLETSMDRKINTKEELANHVESIRDNIDVDTIYETIKKEFSQYITTKDYQSILRVYNQKGMLPQSRLCAICGISTKESYLNFILSILKENKEDAQVIRQAIKASFGL